MAGIKKVTSDDNGDIGVGSVEGEEEKNIKEEVRDWTFLTKQNEEVWRRGVPKLKSGDVTKEIHEIDLESELEECDVCLLVVKKRGTAG